MHLLLESEGEASVQHRTDPALFQCTTGAICFLQQLQRRERLRGRRILAALMPWSQPLMLEHDGRARHSECKAQTLTYRPSVLFPPPPLARPSAGPIALRTYTQVQWSTNAKSGKYWRRCDSKWDHCESQGGEQGDRFARIDDIVGAGRSGGAVSELWRREQRWTKVERSGDAIVRDAPQVSNSSNWRQGRKPTEEAAGYGSSRGRSCHWHVDGICVNETLNGRVELTVSQGHHLCYRLRKRYNMHILGKGKHICMKIRARGSQVRVDINGMARE